MTHPPTRWGVLKGVFRSTTPRPLNTNSMYRGYRVPDLTTHRNTDTMPKRRRPIPRTTPPTATAAGPIELSQTAQALVDRVTNEWTLTPPVLALLRLIAENMTRAEQLDAILARDGLTVPDAKGAAKVHPLALLARDHRNAASAGLQRLVANLEG